MSVSGVNNLSKFYTLILLALTFEKVEVKFYRSKIFEPKIVNGVEASIGQFPWQVGIDFFNASSQWFCGGALINEEWVLTAAHCVADGFNIAYVTAREINYEDNTGVQLSTTEYIIHEEYNSEHYSNDIALLKLNGSFLFNENLTAIDLANAHLQPNSEIIVSGYGQVNDNSDIDKILRWALLSTIDNTDCAAIYGNDVITDDMLCGVSYTNILRGTCFGDSGSPAIIYDGDTPVHVGTVTFISERGCEYADPSMFVRTAYYRDWIKNKTGV